jgi:hypothetical protein
MVPACTYALHRLCAGKNVFPKEGAQWREVIHIRNLTSNVISKLRRSGSPGLRRMRRFGGHGRPGLRTVRACVRRRASGSPGSAPPSTSWLPSRGTRGRAATETRQTRPMTSPAGSLSSGPWLPSSIRNLPGGCPDTSLSQRHQPAGACPGHACPGCPLENAALVSQASKHLGRADLAVRPRRWAKPGSGAGDLDVQRGADICMQPDGDLMLAYRLDRVLDLDLALVQLRAARGLDRSGDVSR